MAKGPKGVTILFSLSEAINALNDSDRGKLLSAILDYAEHGTNPKFNGELKIVFACVKPTIDNNISAYESRCQRNSQNAKKRWNINENQENAVECDRTQKMQTQANNAKVNKSKVNEIKEKDNKEKNIKKENFSVPPEIAEAFAEFEKMRNRIKKPMTDRARRDALAKLEKLAPQDYELQNKILDQSIFNCYVGVFPLKEENGGGGYGQASGTVGKHLDGDRASLEKMSVVVV